MQLNSPLSATARPFQPQATSPPALVDDIPRDYPAWNGLARGSPNRGSTTGLPVRRATPNHRYTSDEEGVTPMRLSPMEGGERKRMGSLVRSRSPNLGARRVILTMWPIPLGSGPVASLIIVNTKRIPTSYP